MERREMLRQLWCCGKKGGRVRIKRFPDSVIFSGLSLSSYLLQLPCSCKLSCSATRAWDRAVLRPVYAYCTIEDREALRTTNLAVAPLNEKRGGLGELHVTISTMLNRERQ